MPHFVVLVIAFILVALPLWLAVFVFCYTLLREQPVDVPKRETTIRKGRAYLRLDGKGLGKNGWVLLTDRRLLWVPILFPVPHLDEQSVMLNKIERCEARRGRWLLTDLLVISTSKHAYHLYVGRAGEWEELIAARKVRK